MWGIADMADGTTLADARGRNVQVRRGMGMAFGLKPHISEQLIWQAVLDQRVRGRTAGGLD